MGTTARQCVHWPSRLANSCLHARRVQLSPLHYEYACTAVNVLADLNSDSKSIGLLPQFLIHMPTMPQADHHQPHGSPSASPKIYLFHLQPAQVSASILELCTGPVILSRTSHACQLISLSLFLPLTLSTDLFSTSL